MQLRIRHISTYGYDRPVHYALQQLRLVPRSGHGQSVLQWQTTVTGGAEQLTFDDQFGNHTKLVLADEGATQIEIVSEGVIDTVDNAGVIGKHKGYAPLWLFTESTPHTVAGPQIRRLARKVRGNDDIVATLHTLSSAILDHVVYAKGRTDSMTSAEEAFAAGNGVCQDHTHIMIAAARCLNLPARYVSGYLLMDDRDSQEASHAWCEVWTGALGWVGFDVSNGISPDDRYVRVAVGRDYRDAAPVHGLRIGNGDERMSVSLQVQQ